MTVKAKVLTGALVSAVMIGGVLYYIPGKADNPNDQFVTVRAEWFDPAERVVVDVRYGPHQYAEQFIDVLGNHFEQSFRVAEGTPVRITIIATPDSPVDCVISSHQGVLDHNKGTGRIACSAQA